MIIICQECDTRFKVSKEAIGPSGRFVQCSACHHEWLAQIQDLLDEESDESNSKNLELNLPKDEAIEAAPPIQESGALPQPHKSTAEVDEANQPEPEIKLEDILSSLDKDVGVGKPSSQSTTNTETPITRSISDSDIDIDAAIRTPRQTYIPPKQEFYAKKGLLLLIKAIIAISIFLAIYLSLIYQREWIESKWPVLEKAYDFFHLVKNDAIKISRADCKIIDTADSVLYINTMEVAVSMEMRNLSDKVQTLQAVRFVVYDKNGDFIGSLIQNVDQEIAPGDIQKIEGKLDQIPKDSTFVSIDLGNTAEMKLRNISRLKKI